MAAPVRAGSFDALTGDAGLFRILAIDHRDALRVMLPDGFDTPDDQVIQLKADLVAITAGIATGVMLDPRFGLQPPVLDVLPDGVGIVAALEAQGYMADDSVTHTTLLEGWDASQAKALGADMGKVLSLWDGEHWTEQDAMIETAVAQTHDVGLPFVLEPLARGLPPTGGWVLDWVRHHAETSADLLKLPYPGSADACAEIARITERPWVILSAGAAFETFEQQAAEAIDGGAVGYIVGRAVWREAATTDTAARKAAIEEHVVPRMEALLRLG
ncbi:hypothetical protein [Euzebya tangerina]|uniref:hypothetical protein n=1 Tax=Euzebya tangerina TaxID=591198 RepID=UPI000E323F4B|nr:hypothetical protein [Euzebya tangerina]